MDPTEPSRIRAVLFDLDDTLSDHRRSAREAVAEICRVVPTLRLQAIAEVERINRDLLEEIHFRVLAGEIDVDGARIERMERLLAHFGDPEAGKQGPRVARLYRESYASVREVVPGAHQLLRELRRRGIQLGVVTNNVIREQELKMADLRLASLVDALVVSEAVGSWKPDTRIFEVALDRLGVDAEASVMVGDSWSSDVIGARRAGILAVWYNPQRLFPPSSEPAPTEIYSLEPAADIANRILAAGD